MISDSLTPVTRCVLLHLLELHLLRWPLLLPDKTGEWYASVLGERVLARRNVISVSSNYPSRSNGQEKSKEVMIKSPVRIIRDCLVRIMKITFKRM